MYQINFTDTGKDHRPFKDRIALLSDALESEGAGRYLGRAGNLCMLLADSEVPNERIVRLLRNLGFTIQIIAL